MLCISAIFILIVRPILDICACPYCWIPSISRFGTGYPACWKWETETPQQWNNAHYPLFAIAPFSFAFSFMLGYKFPLSDLDTFLSVSFEWPADARCRSHDVQIMMSFLFPLAISFSFCISIWQSYSMSDAIVDNCLTGIRIVYWRSKGEGLSVSARWCSVHWARLSITAAILSIYVGRYYLY